MMFVDENGCLCVNPGHVPLSVRNQILRKVRPNAGTLGMTNVVGIPGGVAFYEDNERKRYLVAGCNLPDLQPKCLLAFHTSQSLEKFMGILGQELTRLREAGQ